MSAIVYVSLMLLVGLIQESSGSCVRDGQDYPGADLRAFFAQSLDECIDVCKATRYCKSIAYEPESRQCFMKYRRGGHYGPYLKAITVSANMVCDNKTDQSCTAYNVNYPGADMVRRIVSYFDQCEQFCRDTERCAAITYHPPSRQCWLKSSKDGDKAYGPNNQAGYNSLNMECPPLKSGSLPYK